MIPPLGKKKGSHDESPYLLSSYNHYIAGFSTVGHEAMVAVGS
ncbi:hypothetical protein Acin_0345 [Acidaminococcus intestini RyC-MR95]|jgi:hypothetical protein|uniref:Uncharacterized protein n=1 Tax=Acidaminococcus intestini (strain RyC-MR95) TaxID=568816 RepID=G4Q8G0_ACIIR|nr:hypothetical protein Acin_0345 [Acidaminococcus intestini RyC-MR95]